MNHNQLNHAHFVNYNYFIEKKGFSVGKGIIKYQFDPQCK